MFLTALVFVVSVFFYGCSDENQNLSDLSESKNQSLTIGDIAYDKIIQMDIEYILKKMKI